MHVSAATAEAHGNVGFLPWHRAYLLDLERELQAIDPSVTLPYWRFDRPAPNVFTREFMGVSNAVGRVEFAAGHPFNTWRTDGALGISRTPLFSTGSAPPGLLHRDPDHRARRRRAERRLRELRRHGGQPARLRAHPLQRASSARFRPPRAIRCSSCSTPTSTACGPNGSGCTGARARPRRAPSRRLSRPRRASPSRHDVALERHHRARRDRRRRRAARSRPRAPRRRPASSRWSAR